MMRRRCVSRADLATARDLAGYVQYMHTALWLSIYQRCLVQGVGFTTSPRHQTEIVSGAHPARAQGPKPQGPQSWVLTT